MEPNEFWWQMWDRFHKIVISQIGAILHEELDDCFNKKGKKRRRIKYRGMRLTWLRKHRFYSAALSPAHPLPLMSHKIVNGGCFIAHNYCYALTYTYYTHKHTHKFSLRLRTPRTNLYCRHRTHRHLCFPLKLKPSHSSDINGFLLSNHILPQAENSRNLSKWFQEAHAQYCNRII